MRGLQQIGRKTGISDSPQWNDCCGGSSGAVGECTEGQRRVLRTDACRRCTPLALPCTDKKYLTMGSYPRSCPSFASVFAGLDARIYVISLNQCLENAPDSCVSRLGVDKIRGGQKIPSASTQRRQASGTGWFMDQNVRFTVVRH